MKKIFYLLAVLCLTLSCESKFHKWEYFYEKPDLDEFVGTWSVIDVSYQKLGERYGYNYEKNIKLIIKPSGEFLLENVPALLHGLNDEEVSPQERITYDGTIEFDYLQDRWALNFNTSPSDTFESGWYQAGVGISKNKKDASLLIRYYLIGDDFLAFKKDL